MKLNHNKVGRIVAAIGGFLFCFVPISAWWIETASLRGLREIKQQMRAEGLPTSPDDLKKPLPPDNRNAAPLYRQLTQTLTDKPFKDTDVLNNIPKEIPVPPDKIAAIRQSLQSRQDVVQLVHQAAARPECVFNYDYAQGPNLLFPEFAKMRAGMRVVTNESLLLLQDGKPLDAVRNETLGFRIAKHGACEPILISKLVGISLNGMAARFMERVLYTAGEQPGVAKAVAQAIATDWKTVPMADGMRGEMVMGQVIYEALRAGKSDLSTSDFTLKAKDQVEEPSWILKAMLDANELDLLQHQRQAYLLLSRPYSQARAGLDDLTEDITAHRYMPTRAYSYILLPVYSQAIVKQAQGEAQAGVVRTAASVLAYKQQHGDFPDTLQQAMTTVPIDPFNGQPLRYVNGVSGFVVYSVGQTGRFDGGTRDKKPDSYESVFHYPMPAYYTQSTPPAAATPARTAP